MYKRDVLWMCVCVVQEDVAAGLATVELSLLHRLLVPPQHTDKGLPVENTLLWNPLIWTPMGQKKVSFF